MPKLTSYKLGGLKQVKQVTMMNAGEFQKDEVLLTAMKRIPTIKGKKDMDEIDMNVVEKIEVHNFMCNTKELKELKLTNCFHLREFSVGNECFQSVKEVVLIDLPALEKVLIGDRCFSDPLSKEVPEGSFHLKNCKTLKELRIGCMSFADYCECEMESLEALETVVIGNATENSCCFYWSDLILRSGSHSR